MKEIIGTIIAIIFFLIGLYVGGYVMFIKSIMTACAAFDAGTLTGSLIGLTVIKCIFAGTVGAIIAWIGMVINIILHNA